MGVDNVIQRAKAILSVLDKVSRDYGGDREKAAAELDRDLGPLWRKEVEKADLGEDIPTSHECKQASKISKFYKKLKNKMEDVGENPDSIKGPLPLEDTKNPKSKPKPSIIRRMKIVLLKRGKYDKGCCK